MLFLAVFCGFLAENFREHLVNEKKGRQYIVSLNEDLKIDQAQLQRLIPAYITKNKKIDTLLQLIRGISRSTGANGAYNYLLFSLGFPDFVYTDRTIQQLKNSGDLRLITNKKASDSIIAYDGEVKLFQTLTNEGVSYQMRSLKELTFRLFDLRCCPDIASDIPSNEIHFPDRGSLLTYDNNLIAEYYDNVVWMKEHFSGQKTFLEILLQKNEQLQSLLKKEYHFQ